MNICYFSSKGGASKTTYARLTAEYLTRVKNSILSEKKQYSEDEVKYLREIMKDGHKLRVFNITRHEISIRRYRQYIDELNDIIPSSKIDLDRMMLDIEKKEENVTSLFDIGADSHDQFVELESQEYGKKFFSNIDILFIPIKYDQDSIASAYNATLMLQKYPNISFVYCLTEYLDDLSDDFKNFFNHKTLMPTIHVLQASGRAKLITVPYSKLIRDSDSSNELLIKHCNKLESEHEKNKCRQFSNELFQKFDHAFFNFERDPNIVSEFNPRINKESVSSEVMDELASIKKLIGSIAKNELGTSQKEIDMKPIESAISDVKTSLEKLEIFASPDLEEVLSQIKEKYAANTKKVFMYIFIAAILFPTAIFSIVGYYIGSEVRDSKARNNAQAELKYVNEFSKELYNLGALDVLTIEYSSNRNTASIVCKEESGKCVNRFDPKTNTGYIEIKNAK